MRGCSLWKPRAETGVAWALGEGARLAYLGTCGVQRAGGRRGKVFITYGFLFAPLGTTGVTTNGGRWIQERAGVCVTSLQGIHGFTATGVFNLLTLPLLCFSESVHRNPRAAPSQQLGCLEAGACLIGLWAAELRSQPRPSLLPFHPEQGRVTPARIPFGSKNQEEAPLVTRLGNIMKWNHFVAGRTGRTVNYSVLQIY